MTHRNACQSVLGRKRIFYEISLPWIGDANYTFEEENIYIIEDKINSQPMYQYDFANEY